ncbi:MAG: SMC-Scp complex subunit ScpB [Bacilli bacterium]|nr:SMC-Scp complex subunit ScpB [Bacilli bacterium]MBR3049580.1 SMC-Scp complex subunit ScpB [Bacilli bacterium]
MENKAVLEGLLFVVGEEGLSLEQIEDVLEIDEAEAKELLKSLRDEYEENGRGVRIDFLGNKFKLTTKKEHREYYQKLIENPETNTLSQAALETLAIIAYNEPITRIEVDDIRGVGSAQMVRKLVAKGFIKEVGRSDAPGRPILYKTTSEFLDYFGLPTIEDLPSMADFIQPKEEVEEEDKDLYTSRYKEEVKEETII